MTSKDKVKTNSSKIQDGRTKTTKTQVTVGKTTLVNPETGEYHEFTVVKKNISQDFNFHKIWLQDVLNVLDSFGNKKILVITYLLKNMRNEDNTVSGSYREFAKGCGVSLPTVSVVLNELLESDILKKIKLGTYQFNPSLIVKGNSDKRRNLLIQYHCEDDEVIENAKDVEIDTEGSEEVVSSQTNLLDAISKAEK